MKETKIRREGWSEEWERLDRCEGGKCWRCGRKDKVKRKAEKTSECEEWKKKEGKDERWTEVRVSDLRKAGRKTGERKLKKRTEGRRKKQKKRWKSENVYGRTTKGIKGR